MICLDSALHLALQNVPDYFHNLEPRVGGSEDQLASVLVFTTRKTVGSEDNYLIKAAADQLSNHFEVRYICSVYYRYYLFFKVKEDLYYHLY